MAGSGVDYRAPDRRASHVESSRSPHGPPIARNSRITLQRRLTLAKDSPRRQLVRANDEDLVDIINVSTFIYLAEIKIGGYKFPLVVDTGSSDTWISCEALAMTPCRSTCPMESTLIVYGSGSVCIDARKAPIELGGIQIQEYIVGVGQGPTMDSSGADPLLPPVASGILGLAYSSIAAIPTPGGQLIDYMKSFSVYLSSGIDEAGSFLLIDNVDQELVARRQLTPYAVSLKRKEHWTIGLTAFRMGEAEATVPCSQTTSGSCDAFVDTGTSLLIMPKRLYAEFETNYLRPRGCAIDRRLSTSVYACPRNVELPTFQFTFGNLTLQLSGENYTLPVSTSSVLVEVQPYESSNDEHWILGATLLQVYYTDFIVNDSIQFYCPEGFCSLGASPSPANKTDANTSPGKSRSDSTSAPSDSGSSQASSNTALVTGLSIAVGLLATTLLVLLAVLAYRRYRRRQEEERSTTSSFIAVTSPQNAPTSQYEPTSRTPASRNPPFQAQEAEL